MEINKRKRLHLPLLNGVESILKEVFIHGKKSDQVVPSVLKSNPKWGSRDRSFVAENSYEIVRNKRLILYCLNEKADVNEGVIQKMVATWLLLKNLQDDSEYFNDLETENIKERATVSDPKIRFSVPDALNAHVVSELGEERWYSELEAMSSPADVFLRVNLSKISREKLKNKLFLKEIETEEVPNISGALKLMKRVNISSSEEFRKGLFEVQDAGSQHIGTFLNPKPGSTVIDACAGAGGKTLHLADLMQGSGQIIAMDVEASKLKELETRAIRNKVNLVKTELISNAVIKKYKEKADYLLLDVPCSGLGIIKRNPDAKEKLNEDFINEIKEIQQNILQEYSSMLKSGGSMVYATCSILPSENSEQVKTFLESNKDFKLMDEHQIWPSESGFDGFYMALLRKK